MYNCLRVSGILQALNVNPLHLKKIYGSLFLFFLAGLTTARAQSQQVDSIFFHLYTDSLKKGVHNYINVDGKLSNGRWQPLTGKELAFTASYGRFDGCNLIVDSAFKGEKIAVKAVLKANPQIWREATIYMKTVDTVERLRTVDEILNTPSPGSRRGRKDRRGT
jgi:hypothetical protein